MEDEKLIARFDGLEKLIDGYAKLTADSVHQLTARVSELEKVVGSVEKDNDELKVRTGITQKILTKLLQDQNAILRQDAAHCAVKSQSVTEAANEERYSRLRLLQELDAEGRIEKDFESGKTRYTKKISVNGVRPRAVIINIY